MTAEETTVLLARLVESFIDHPRDLGIDYKEFHQRVDFRIKGHISDQGKLVGKLAAHVKALRFILEAMGDKAGLQYHLRLEDPEPADRAPPGPKRVAGPDYKPEPLVRLLGDLLVALLDEPPVIAVSHAYDVTGSNFCFCIGCQRVQDYEKLVTMNAGASILTSLGTLFRAAGHRDGATIKLEVPGRKMP